MQTTHAPGQTPMLCRAVGQTSFGITKSDQGYSTTQRKYAERKSGQMPIDECNKPKACGTAVNSQRKDPIRDIWDSEISVPVTA